MSEWRARQEMGERPEAVNPDVEMAEATALPLLAPPVGVVMPPASQPAQPQNQFQRVQVTVSTTNYARTRTWDVDMQQCRDVAIRIHPGQTKIHLALRYVPAPNDQGNWVCESISTNPA